VVVEKLFTTARKNCIGNQQLLRLNTFLVDAVVVALDGLHWMSHYFPPHMRKSHRRCISGVGTALLQDRIPQQECSGYRIRKNGLLAAYIYNIIYSGTILDHNDANAYVHGRLQHLKACDDFVM
jgi:hypothetical protein